MPSTPKKESSRKSSGSTTPDSKRRRSERLSSERSPSGKNVTDNFESPKDKYKRVWPSPVKAVRDAVIPYKKEYDESIKRSKMGMSAEMEQHFKLSEFEHSKPAEDELNGLIQEINELKSLYGDKTMKCLDPANYRLLVSQGKPYLLGRGAFGKALLAQEIESGQLVVLKAIERKNDKSRFDIVKKLLREYGYLHKASGILEQENNFAPSYLRGFFKIEQSSPLNDYFYDIVAASSLVSLVPNVPVCLPVSHARNMLMKKKELPIQLEEWKHIIYLMIKGVIVLNNAGIAHYDMKEGNMCIVYKDGKYVLSIIDFGNSLDFADNPDYTRYNRDILGTMRVIQRTVGLFSFTKTEAFAKSVASKSISVNRDTILQQLNEVLIQDLEQIIKNSDH